MTRLMVIVFLAALAAPAHAQELTNYPLFLSSEGPSTLRRNHVHPTGSAKIRWTLRPVYEINPNTGRPRVWTNVVIARWDEQACARQRGPFCTKRGGWMLDAAMRSREDANEAQTSSGNSGRYLIFGRSRHDPSAPDSWQMDMLIADEPSDDAPGARLLTFDSSSTVGGTSRYSVVVEPGSG